MSDEPPEEGAPPTEPPAAEPSRPTRRRAQRRPAPAEEEATQATGSPSADVTVPLADEDEGVPAFARRFPRDPALDALVSAFEAGDYARVRREAPALAKAPHPEDVRAGARELARRIEPDPLAKRLLVMAVALLLFLAGWYWLHPHTG